MKRILFLAAVGLTVRHALAESSDSRNSSCLTSFFSNREHFAPCTKTVCFLFIEQPPYSILDPTMSGTEHQRLFACRNKHKWFRHLEGVNFLIAQAMVMDTLCVWAGPCTEDELIQFIIDRFADPSTKKYRFGAQGMIAQLPERMSSKIQATVTILDAPIILVKSLSKGKQTGFMKSVGSLFLGFDITTWVMILIYMTGLTLLAFVITYVFTGSIIPLDVLLHILGHFTAKMQANRMKKKVQGYYRVAVVLLCAAFSAFAFLTILFYEISVVNFLNVSEATLPKKLMDLSDSELNSFCMLQDSGAERTFVTAADPNSTRFKSGYPWVRVKDREACFKALLDPSSRLSILVAHQPEALYGIRRFKMCEKVSQVITEYDYMTSWFLSSTVPEDVVQNLDRDILRIKITGQLKQIIDDETGQNQKGCSKEVLSIGPQVIGVPLFVLLSPIVLLQMCFIIVACTSEQKHRVMF